MAMRAQIIEAVRAKRNGIKTKSEKAQGGQTAAIGAAEDSDWSELESLLKARRQMFFRIALRITGNHEDAEDVVQQAFHKALVHLHEFRGKSALSTWVTRIAVNEALMLKRRNRSARQLSIDDPESQTVARPVMPLRDARSNPERKYAEVEWRRIFNAALRSLQPAMRLALQIHGIDELSLSQTAGLMGISLCAAKSRVFRARKLLRAKLIPALAPADRFSIDERQCA
jgi:RNA polymerase sigma factor (sigma-70 family)